MKHHFSLLTNHFKLKIRSFIFTNNIKPFKLTNNIKPFKLIEKYFTSIILLFVPIVSFGGFSCMNWKDSRINHDDKSYRQFCDRIEKNNITSCRELTRTMKNIVDEKQDKNDFLSKNSYYTECDEFKYFVNEINKNNNVNIKIKGGKHYVNYVNTVVKFCGDPNDKIVYNLNYIDNIKRE